MNFFISDKIFENFYKNDCKFQNKNNNFKNNDDWFLRKINFLQIKKIEYNYKKNL